MDCRTGGIYRAEQVAGMAVEDQKYMRPVMTELMRTQRRTGKVGRNDPCPCGSGQKFKRCCLIRRFTPNA
jgi:uncharacterized protein YecA (UPF0149 family)